MNKIQQPIAILAIAISIVLSGCNRAPIAEPTMYKAPTYTQAPERTARPIFSATATQTLQPIFSATVTKQPTLAATLTPTAQMYFDLERMRAIEEMCLNSSMAELAYVQFHPGAGFEAIFSILSPCYGTDMFTATASEFGWQTGAWSGNPFPDTTILLFVKPDSPGGGEYEFVFAPDQIEQYQGTHVFPPLEMAMNQEETPIPVQSLVPDFDISLGFPLPGANLHAWGAYGMTIVWAGTATYPTNCTDSTDAPMDYYCRNEPSRSNQFWGNWGNDSLHAAGVIQNDGATTILFDQPVRDIVLVWGMPTYVDSIEAILEDGTLIPMGYTPHSTGVLEYQGNLFSPIVPFMESDGSWNKTIETHGWNSHGFDMNTYDPQPCGFMGLGPDNNLILIPNPQNGESSTGLLGLFPRYSYRNLEYGVYKRGLNAYLITGIIITQYDELPAGSTLCK